MVSLGEQRSRLRRGRRRKKKKKRRKAPPAIKKVATCIGCTSSNSTTEDRRWTNLSKISVVSRAEARAQTARPPPSTH